MHSPYKEYIVVQPWLHMAPCDLPPARRSLPEAYLVTALDLSAVSLCKPLPEIKKAVKKVSIPLFIIFERGINAACIHTLQ